jgi:hypothetical protein
MNVNVKCPYCNEETVIEIDGNCESCGSPLGFPAISKAEEKKVLGKIFTTDRPEVLPKKKSKKKK